MHKPEGKKKMMESQIFGRVYQISREVQAYYFVWIVPFLNKDYTADCLPHCGPDDCFLCRVPDEGNDRELEAIV